MNPSSRIQERTYHKEFKIKERDYENVKRGQRMKPSLRIQERTHYQEFKNEPVIKNSRTNLLLRIQD